MPARLVAAAAVPMSGGKARAEVKTRGEDESAGISESGGVRRCTRAFLRTSGRARSHTSLTCPMPTTQLQIVNRIRWLIWNSVTGLKLL